MYATLYGWFYSSFRNLAVAIELPTEGFGGEAASEAGGIARALLNVGAAMLVHWRSRAVWVGSVCF